MTTIDLANFDFQQEIWERTFPDTSTVYVFDNIHSPSVPHWSMVGANELPMIDPEGNYRLDGGPGNVFVYRALLDLLLEVRRILPTARILVAPRLYLPDGNGGWKLEKATAVTEFDRRLERAGWFSVPTLLLSTNQSVEDAYREMYRFLWMLLEAEIPFVNPEGTMEAIERTAADRTDPIFYDWLSKFPKEPGETRDAFLIRIAQERRALMFVNMAMARISGCWHDDASPAAEIRRPTHDLMFRSALRGHLGKQIKSAYAPIPEQTDVA